MQLREDCNLDRIEKIHKPSVSSTRASSGPKHSSLHTFTLELRQVPTEATLSTFPSSWFYQHLQIKPYSRFFMRFFLLLHFVEYDFLHLCTLAGFLQMGDFFCTLFSTELREPGRWPLKCTWSFVFWFTENILSNQLIITFVFKSEQHKFGQMTTENFCFYWFNLLYSHILKNTPLNQTVVKAFSFMYLITMTI